ncbi:MAG: class I SAM-dependent methyltransferase, partial [Pseudomonadota bacterium]|nr:class I SAM-dependent methyltransferase [Pseudomonadota bacterium]
GLHVSGSDVSPALIGVAREKYSDIKFSVEDFTQPDSSFLSPDYDVVSLLGVHGRFRRLDSWLPCFTSLISKNGYGLIFDLFNSEPVDVVVSASASETQERGYDNTYFNMVSIDSVSNKLSTLGFRSRFHRFEMPFVIEKPSDPFRSWTIDLATGKRMLTNGLGQIFDLYLCVVYK